MFENDLTPINRSVITVRAKQPMADWLAQLPDRDESEIERPITVDNINDDSAVYLAPSFETTDAMNRYLSKIKIDLFEEILEGWITEPSLWPQDRSKKMFDQWFDVEMHSLAFDLCEDKPLEHENYEE